MQMQLFKISCSQCPHYDACPQKTRMFVNYCGSRIKSVELHIREAISECRSKRGFMLVSEIFHLGPARLTDRETLAAAKSP
jgi:hypothetical protein